VAGQRPPSIVARLGPIGRIGPGLLAAAVVATAARLAATVVPHEISEVTLAILIALVVGGRPAIHAARFQPGLRLASNRLLRLGIILIGARLSIQQVAAIGLPAVVIVVVTMAAALTLVLLLARIAAVDDRLAILLAVGAAVCGNTAVVATTPVIRARPRDTAYAVATVTLFGTIAVIVYPLIGHLTHLGDAAFGLWSGIAINDTSQVLGASRAYSPDANEIATVVKLIRNALMAPLLIGIAWTWVRRTGVAGDPRGGVRRAVPWFVLGFLALAALRSGGVIDAPLAASLDVVAGAVILVALSAVGLSVRLENLREVGPRPILVGLGAALLIGTATILAITTFGLANGLAVGP
jgi:uncharacterized integral membrane protein (TIGR00698 family)